MRDRNRQHNERKNCFPLIFDNDSLARFHVYHTDYTS